MAPTRPLSMARAVSFFAAPALVAAILVGSGSAGCSTSAKLVGTGGQCQLASDCDEGLVCIPSGSGRVCSNDLAAIQKTESTPAADAATDGPPNVYDAPYDDIDGGTTTTTPPPTMTPDATTTTPPPTDTPDSAPAPEMDSAPAPVKDAAPAPVMDASSD